MVSSPTSSGRKGDSPLFSNESEKRKKGTVPFLLALEERIPKAKSDMVGSAISQNVDLE